MNAAAVEWILAATDWWLGAVGQALLQAALMLLVLAGLRLATRSRVPAALWCMGWLLVLVRLAVLVVPSTPLSLQAWGARLTSMLFTPAARAIAPPVGTPAPVAQSALGGAADLTAAPAASSGLDSWAVGLAAVWFAGALVMLLVLARRRQSMRALLRGARPLEDPALRALLRDSAATMGVRRGVELCAASGVTTPTVCGVFRPRILLPEGLASQLGAADLRYVLLHELAHIRRHDLLAGWFTALVLVAHWFNPCAWLAARWLRRDRELACDALALALLGPVDRRQYGRALLDTVELGGRGAQGTLLSAHIGEGAHELHQRIRALVAYRAPSRWVLGSSWLVLLAAACVTMTDPPSDAPDETEPGTGKTLTEFASTESLAGWFMSGAGSTDYVADVDADGPALRLRLRPELTAPSRYGVLMQQVGAAPYRGKRLRVTALVDGKNITGYGNMWARVQGFDSPADGPGLGGGSCYVPAGNLDWQPCTMVFDVAAGGERIEIGCGLRATGTLRVRSLRVEEVSQQVARSSLTVAEVYNGDMEWRGVGGVDGWAVSGGGRYTYRAVVDTAHPHGGRSSARLEKKVATDQYGTLMQNLDAKAYRGRRWRMTAYVRGVDLLARGDFWLRVQAPDSPGDGPGLGGGRCTLAGTFDWRPCVIEFDVPAEGRFIQYGVGIAGPGTAWLDDVTLEPLAPTGT